MIGALRVNFFVTDSAEDFKGFSLMDLTHKDIRYGSDKGKHLHFYSYKGTFTRPPCEVANWIVFQDAVELDSYQVMVVQNTHRTFKRNIKPLARRVKIILYSFTYMFNSFLLVATFKFAFFLFYFKINFFEKLFQEYDQSVTKYGSGSGSTFCWALSGSKLIAKAISRRR